jgi:hypothetical protein
MLFLGSGVSYHAFGNKEGLPDVSNITTSVIQDKWYFYNYDKVLPGKNPNEAYRPDPWVQKIQEFLKLLKSYADSCLSARGRPEATYEDLYYLSNHIHLEECNSIANPAEFSFVNEIRQKTVNLCKPEKEFALEKLADKSCEFIKCVVSSKLGTFNILGNTKAPEGFELLKHLYNDSEIKHLDIATTNHDLLIEKYLELKLEKSPYIDYADGFGQKNGDYRDLDMSRYKDEKIRIHLYKLHGSINWCTYQDDDYKNRYHLISKDEMDCKDSHGKTRSVFGHGILFLTGTYNKTTSYSFGITLQMMSQFDQALFEHTTILMSGYGWNDDGINLRLITWLDSSINNKIILLAKDFHKEKKEYFPWWRINEFIKNKQICVIDKWFEDIDNNDKYEELKTKFNKEPKVKETKEESFKKSRQAFLQKRKNGEYLDI